MVFSVVGFVLDCAVLYPLQPIEIVENKQKQFKLDLWNVLLVICGMCFTYVRILARLIGGNDRYLT